MLIFCFLVFCLSLVTQSTKITRGVIVGSGRIGLHLYESNQRQDFLLKRGDMFRSNLIEDCPIYVCTRNDDLEQVINFTPPNQRKNLVFLQNGILAPLLQQYELFNNTQALIYYGIAKKGDPPVDGKTELNPEGLTCVTGIWSEDFAERLHQTGLSCKILAKDLWLQSMLEKHIWICAFMAVGVKYRVTVGVVDSQHREEVSELIRELAKAGSEALKINLTDGVVERLCAYAKSVAEFPTNIKELKWRNGWFLDLSQRYLKEGKKDPCPLHSSLMKQLYHK